MICCFLLKNLHFAIKFCIFALSFNPIYQNIMPWKTDGLRKKKHKNSYSPDWFSLFIRMTVLVYSTFGSENACICFPFTFVSIIMTAVHPSMLTAVSAVVIHASLKTNPCTSRIFMNCSLSAFTRDSRTLRRGRSGSPMAWTNWRQCSITTFSILTVLK